jgi:hypothetical protein
MMSFVIDRVLTCKTVEGISFVKWGGDEGLDAVSRLYTVSRLVGDTLSSRYFAGVAL